MINVSDRIPSPGKANRVKITLDDGQVIEGVLDFADDAIDQGTYWNKKTSQLLQGDIREFPVKQSDFAISAGDPVDIGPDGVYRNVVIGKNVEYPLNKGYVYKSACEVLKDNYVFVALWISQTIYATVINLDTMQSISVGASHSLPSTQSISDFSLCVLSESLAIVQYTYNNVLYAVPFYCEYRPDSGTYAIFVRNQTQIYSTNYGGSDCIKLDDSRFLSVYAKDGIYAKVVVANTSGISQVTSGASKPIENIPFYFSSISACSLPDDAGNKRVFLSMTESNGGEYLIVATISPDNTVTFGDYIGTGNFTHGVTPTHCASSDKYVVVSYKKKIHVYDSTYLSLIGKKDIPVDFSTTSLEKVSNSVFVAISGTTGFVISVSRNDFTIGPQSNIYTLSSVGSACGISEKEIFSITSGDGTFTTMAVYENVIGGSFTDISKTAIALQGGTMEKIRVGFSGACECDGVSVGTEVLTDGVKAVCNVDGWLNIYPPVLSSCKVGTYVGTGEDMTIDIGFVPSCMQITKLSDTSKSSTIITKYSSLITTIETTSAAIFYMGKIVFFQDGTVKIYADGASDESRSAVKLGEVFSYIAWR